MIAMACLLPSRATTTEAEKVEMAVKNAAKSTGGFENAGLPPILSCIWVRRDTKPSDDKRRKSNKTFNFFTVVVMAFHLLSFLIDEENFSPSLSTTVLTPSFDTLNEKIFSDSFSGDAKWKFASRNGCSRYETDVR